jgi:hypothetical protein
MAGCNGIDADSNAIVAVITGKLRLCCDPLPVSRGQRHLRSLQGRLQPLLFPVHLRDGGVALVEVPDHRAFVCFVD